MTLLERIKHLCEARGETLASLERKMDFGNGTIRRWGDTTPSGDKLAKVADFFHVSVDYLLGRESPGENTLDGVYLRFAKQAQENGISPSDIQLAIDTIKKLRGE